MRRVSYLLWLLLIQLGFSNNICAQVSNDNEDGVYQIPSHNINDFVPGQVLVKFKDANRIQVRRAAGRVTTTNSTPLTELLQKYGDLDMEQLLPNENPRRTMRRSRAYNGETVQEHDLSQLYLINKKVSDDQETTQMVKDLQALDEVEFAEPNYKVYIMADDNIAADYSANPMVSQQWYLDAYGVKELWNKPIINKPRPVIAIIDTGVDITHPDLKDNIWTNQVEADGRDDYDNDRNGFKNDIHGWDFINNTPKMRDNNSHGTHVAGIAAAANNGVGIVGANPQALIMPVTVLQSDGIGDNATLIRGINYAVNNSATVINMSIGTYANSNALRQALENAYQSAVIVAAAGNDNRCIYKSHPHITPPPMPCFPAAYSFVLGVQATTPSGSLASFSNYDDDGPLSSCESTVQDPDGFNYELKAPGTQILSSIPGGRYVEYQGTSMSSPLVAGAVSVLLMVKQYDNWEILWGDLLHSDNIAGAYNVTKRPAELDLTRIMLRDRNEQTDGDLKYYDVNVGESLNIYPVIRTTFGSASNIKLKVVVPSGVEVITNDVDFGFNLDAYGKMTSKNPLTIKVPDEMPNASEIKITVQATCQESDKTCSNSFTLRVANRYTLKGMLTEDMTLTPDHVYYVSGRVGVSEGTTLTIKPGTRLEFGKDAGLFGFGTLNIKGTPEAPIIMTAYDETKRWSGIYSHKPSGRRDYNGVIYTNKDTTLFTLLPTQDISIKLENYNSFYQRFYYDTEDNKPVSLSLIGYMDSWMNDMTGKEELLIDPNYITPAMLKMLDDWNMYCKKYPTQYTDEMRYSTYVNLNLPSWYRYSNPTDTLKYCRLDGFYDGDVWIGGSVSHDNPYYFDCILHLTPSSSGGYVYPKIFGKRNVVTVIDGKLNLLDIRSVSHTNFINNFLTGPYNMYGNNLGESNFFNNYFIDSNTHKLYMLEVISSTPETVKIDPLPYFGTAREDFLRPLIYEYGNTDGMTGWQTYATLDLTNMQKEPYHEAHGIVWKVLVDGKDAQDEQEELLPLGVGKHKFEVYFNRPMNKATKPQISFGVISPYTQHPVSEDDGWNDDGTIYTAYVTIDGKTQSDGMNRICVQDAEDNEFFPCPIEATRFNIMLQAAGSMASGFQADAGLGCVNLTWNNENNDFEDAMGFNVYRYIQGENGVNDTIRINEDVLDISATSYIDDNIIPGQTYYYYYKVLSTALQEYDVSNVVAATPLTATCGDANGSGIVDVADVVTTVNYVTGLQPKPFVFDAADMNSDKLIDIFDVVGIIRGILNPNLLATASLNDQPAVYSIENGTLYVESPVALGGVQVQLTLDRRSEKTEVRVADDLEGFETASTWLSDNDYLFLAYSMNGKMLTPGKHALLHIGDAEVTSLRLSDTQGRNVNVSNGETTGIDRMGKHVMNVKGIYTLGGQKLSGNADNLKKLPKGIYIINGEKVIK